MSFIVQSVKDSRSRLSRQPCLWFGCPCIFNTTDKLKKHVAVHVSEGAEQREGVNKFLVTVPIATSEYPPSMMFIHVIGKCAAVGSPTVMRCKSTYKITL